MKFLPYKITNNVSASVMLIAITFFIAMLTSCGNSTTGTDAPVVKAEEKTKPADPADPEAAKEVQIKKQQYDAIKIQLGSIEQKNMANVLKATGFLSVPPQNKASITSALGGTIRQIFVQEGDYVKKGQTLATLVNPEFVKMQQDYLETQAGLAFAKAQYERQKELSANEVSAKKTFQEAEANYLSLVAKLNSLKAQFSLMGINAANISSGNISSVINVRSPINGTISKVEVNLGLTVEPSKNLMEVVDNAHLHLDVFVYEQDLPKVKSGQNIDFTLINLPGKNYTAKIYSVGSAFENETKTISVHAEITGEKTGLIEGMNVTGLINIGQNISTAVLSSAIVSNSGNDYIFIEKQDSLHAGNEAQGLFTFEKIHVKKGITTGGYTEVSPLEEIHANAKVVTNGAFYLMAILTNAGEEE